MLLLFQVTDILRVEGGQMPPANMAEAPPGFKGAVLISSREAKTPLTMGMDADNQISVDEYSASKVFEVFNDRSVIRGPEFFQDM